MTRTIKKECNMTGFIKEKKINIKEFWENKLKIGIVCNNIEEVNTFCKVSHNLGYKWNTGNSYISLSYYNNTDGVIIYFNTGFCSTSKDKNKLIKDAKDNYFIILEFKEVDFNINNKDDGKLITISEFWDSKLDNGIICTSIKEAYEFCIASHNLGYTWFNGVSYLAESQYEQHGQTIIYTNNNFWFLCDDQELTLKDAEDHKFINYWFSEIDFDITKKGTRTDKMTIKQFWDNPKQLGCVCRNSDEASTFARESSRLYKHNSWRNYDYYLEIGKKEAIFTNGGVFFTDVNITDNLKSYDIYSLVDFKDIDFKGVELK